MAEVTPQQVLSELVEGNKRFAEGRAEHPRQTTVRRTEVAKRQSPHTVVIACSDSRTPPELLFDQGLGDLYVVRLAGGVVEKEALGSIEYAVKRFNVRLIVVLGHERCSAIETAVKGGYVTGNLGDLIWALKPAVVRASAKPGDQVDNVMRAQVVMTVERLKGVGPVISEMVRQKRLLIVGMRYDLDTGKVEFLSSVVD
jgi:carbonic anhydrase